MERLEILKGNIVFLDVDAIVNAANSSLLGGGGVDGAIHQAAGEELKAECALLNGCNTGEAKITKGYKLKAKHVIHTVGPIYYDGNQNESELLSKCYSNSLKVALENNLKVIAFPAISTGAYGYPKREAAHIALRECMKFLNENPDFEKIIMVCFSDKDVEIYTRAFNILSDNIFTNQ
ncbi:MAG: O-acetyl-ADP-ribose deacetylase [Prevotellaceae bacterium]|jgi:O-acetyl-ADP-ribose deacetylase (regulator of RNase III)|nr:O-acetyl-ADP-ribose deacetylase [Prevotellaceae bacterium]